MAVDPRLLDEVTGLVEWPLAMVGRIDETFMDVPQEVLITSMRAHQKYFPLLDADGRLAPRFVVIANTVTTDGGRAIVAGNERVLRGAAIGRQVLLGSGPQATARARVDKLRQRVFHATTGLRFRAGGAVATTGGGRGRRDRRRAWLAQNGRHC